jgi:hypothetical protein
MARRFFGGSFFLRHRIFARSHRQRQQLFLHMLTTGSDTLLAQSAPALSRLATLISQTLTNLSCLQLPCLFSGQLRTWHRSLQIPARGSDLVSRRAPSAGFLLLLDKPAHQDAEHERQLEPLPANVYSTRPGFTVRRPCAHQGKTSSVSWEPVTLIFGELGT